MQQAELQRELTISLAILTVDNRSAIDLFDRVVGEEVLVVIERLSRPAVEVVLSSHVDLAHAVHLLFVVVNPLKRCFFGRS